MNFKKMFPEDGPIKISEEIFALYRNLNDEPSAAVMLRHWLCDDDSDGLRILYLRDLLRSASVSRDAEVWKHTYYSFDYGVTRMLYNDDFKSAVRCRSKIRQELYSELLYNLKNKFYGGEKDDIDNLILFMIPYLSEDEGRELWKYHRLVALKPRRVEEALGLISCGKCKSEWLSVEIERLVMKVTAEEIEQHRGELEMCSTLYPDCVEGLKAVIDVWDFVENEMVYMGGNREAAERMMEFLHNALPANVKFIDERSFPKEIRLLADEPKLVLGVARRHLLGRSFNGEQCWMNTLDWELCMCWLIAIRSYYDPEDVEFGEQLQGLLGDMKERRATWLSES